MFRVSFLLKSSASAIIPTRSFRLDAISSKLSPTDILLAKEENNSVFSYLSFQNGSPEAVASRLLALEEKDRLYHVVCGRENIPCDFYADIDLPSGVDKAEATVADVISCLELRLKPFHPGKFEHLLLHSPSAKKMSFHLHTRCESVLLSDFKAAGALADEINRDLMGNVIDTNCYRANGMLRCAYSAKSDDLSSRPVPYSPTTSLLSQSILPADALSRTETLIRSFVLRGGKVPRGVNLVKLRSIAMGAGKGTSSPGITGNDVDEHGNPVSRFMADSAKWRRYNSAVLKLRKLPSKAAVDFNTWVRVGLALHNFSPDEQQFEEWVRFSLKCPQKFSRDMCLKKWNQFERNPDKRNWRRGYNYLTSSIWRHIGQ